MVTGGSDGIGLGMCKKLAKDGFNICIIARNEEKINTVLQSIRDEFGVKTMCVVADFSKMSTMAEYN